MKELVKKDPSKSSPAKSEPPAWFDIAIAGKRFTIASRQGEAHIRQVERLLNATYEEIKSRSKGQSILHLALLTALNLADQLLMLKDSQDSVRGEWEQRLDLIVATLDAALTAESTAEEAAPLNGGSSESNPGSTSPRIPRELASIRD
ncbi:MAG: cell division protein ZapA [Deltaproteobacteria bacterium]|nr:cell division protein ZapA [Deltaproteobacteria bacterium]